MKIPQRQICHRGRVSSLETYRMVLPHQHHQRQPMRHQARHLNQRCDLKKPTKFGPKNQ